MVVLAGCSGSPDGAATPLAPGGFEPSKTPFVSATAEPSPGASTSTGEGNGSASEMVVAAQVKTVKVNSGDSSATVSGSVAGVAEDGGDCLFIFTSDRAAHPVIAPAIGQAAGDTTSCGPVDVAPGQLARGHWNVVLAYRSGHADVQSEPFSLDVP